MGLDLFHRKATMTPPTDDEGCQFRADEFDDQALDQLGFRRYLQIIPDFDYPARIVIAPDQAIIDRLSITGNWYYEKLVATFVGNLGELIEQVERVEYQHKLDCSQRLTHVSHRWLDHDGICVGCSPRLADADWAGFGWGPMSGVRAQLERRPPLPPSSFYQYIEIHYPFPADYLGLYAEQVGYQRKGMTAGFYENFDSGFICWRRADVERAASFVITDDRVFDEQEPRGWYVKNFRAQFLDNFEEGRSIFSGSY